MRQIALTGPRISRPFLFGKFMDFVELLILILAAFRITRLFVDDSEGGPWNIMARIRYWMGYRYDEENRPAYTGVVSSALFCWWCFSFWANSRKSFLAWSFSAASAARG